MAFMNAGLGFSPGKITKKFVKVAGKVAFAPIKTAVVMPGKKIASLAHHNVKPQGVQPIATLQSAVKKALDKKALTSGEQALLQAIAAKGISGKPLTAEEEKANNILHIIKTQAFKGEVISHDQWLNLKMTQYQAHFKLRDKNGNRVAIDAEGNRLAKLVQMRPAPRPGVFGKKIIEDKRVRAARIIGNTVHRVKASKAVAKQAQTVDQNKMYVAQVKAASDAKKRLASMNIAPRPATGSKASQIMKTTSAVTTLTLAPVGPATRSAMPPAGVISAKPQDVSAPQPSAQAQVSAMVANDSQAREMAVQAMVDKGTPPVVAEANADKIADGKMEPPESVMDTVGSEIKAQEGTGKGKVLLVLGGLAAAAMLLGGGGN